MVVVVLQLLGAAFVSAYFLLSEAQTSATTDVPELQVRRWSLCRSAERRL